MEKVSDGLVKRNIYKERWLEFCPGLESPQKKSLRQGFGYKQFIGRWSQEALWGSREERQGRSGSQQTIPLQATGVQTCRTPLGKCLKSWGNKHHLFQPSRPAASLVDKCLHKTIWKSLLWMGENSPAHYVQNTYGWLWLPGLVWTHWHEAKTWFASSCEIIMTFTSHKRRLPYYQPMLFIFSYVLFIALERCWARA